MLGPLVRKLEQFAKLRDDDKAALAAAVSTVEEYGPKQDIIGQGDRPDSVHLLLEGWAGRYKLDPQGGRQIMAFLIPGDLCDVHITVLDQMDHAIGSLSSCRVAFFPRDDLFQLMIGRPELGTALWWCTLVDEAILREWLVNVGGRPAEKRVGHLICEMLVRSRAVGLTDGDCFDMPLTQEQLGDTVGLSTVHMNRTLQALRGQDLITMGDGRVCVRNLDRLMAFCDFDPLYLHQQGKAGLNRTAAH